MLYRTTVVGGEVLSPAWTASSTACSISPPMDNTPPKLEPSDTSLPLFDSLSRGRKLK